MFLYPSLFFSAFLPLCISFGPLSPLAPLSSPVSSCSRFLFRFLFFLDLRRLKRLFGRVAEGPELLRQMLKDYLVVSVSFMASGRIVLVVVAVGHRSSRGTATRFSQLLRCAAEPHL